MRNIPHKVTGDELSADEYNTGSQEELENAVTSSGISLSAGDLYQLAKMVATYSAIGDFYVDTGSGNTYILTPDSPMQAPIQYRNGMRVRFEISHTNTGPAQINVNGLGLKDILKEDGISPLGPGDLPIGEHGELEFFVSKNAFLLYSHKYEDQVFTTGDWKWTLKGVADAGWILYYADGSTIGDASSAASIRANVDCESLFKLIWTNISFPSSNTRCPVVGGIGVSANADWLAHKKITLPFIDDRVFAVNGTGDGYNDGTGSYYGFKTVTLTVPQLPSHSHGITDAGHVHTIYDPHHLHVAYTQYYNGDKSGGDTDINTYETTKNSGSSPTGIVVQSATTGITINSAGSGTGHDNIQPTSYMNVMLKL